MCCGRTSAGRSWRRRWTSLHAAIAGSAGRPGGAAHERRSRPSAGGERRRLPPATGVVHGDAAGGGGDRVGRRGGLPAWRCLGKIGRASGWERGGQFVCVPVAAV